MRGSWICEKGCGSRSASSPVGYVCAAYVNLADDVWFDEGPAQAEELYATAIELGDRRGAIARRQLGTDGDDVAGVRHRALGHVARDR